MRNLCSVVLLLWLASPLAAQQPSPDADQPPVARATRADEPITVDGVLDEAAWSLAQPVTQFLQREPRQDAPASEATEVRILFSTETIYFGVFCRDRDPAGIRATELRRDDPLRNDDIFELVLDTFHDRRNGYLFRTNPLGTKYDATVANDGTATNENWDEQWDVATSVTADGWVAEIAIPFKSVRFLTEEPIVWGVNFHRDIKRKNEEVYWTAQSRDFQFAEVSRAGTLEGLEGIQGFRLRVKPYFATGGSQESRNGRTETRHLTDVGIEDAKFMFTPRLALDLTVNPDFAQAEVDEAQVNLTRFSQFFPEKREFFQERSGIFDFGSAERVGQPQVLLFHSRSIGLSEDRREIPIYGGLKLTGKQGPLDVGVLNMQTQREDATPGQNFSTVRVKGNLLARSYVGAIFTRNTGGLSGRSNRAGGLDASFTFWRNLNLRGFLAKSDSGDRKDGEWAGQAVLDWESDLLEFTLEHISIQENFNPEMGFVRRGNVKRNFGELDYQPRPNIEGVRQMEFGTEFELITNQEGRLETRRVEAEWGTEFESGDSTNLTFTRTLERLDVPFPIRSGGTVPAGSYEFNDYQFTFEGFEGRRISGEFAAATGAFFNGRRTRVGIAPQIKPSERLSFEPFYEWNWIRLPDAKFTTHEFNGRVNYSFTQRWLTATTILVNSQDQQYAFNFRLNYILQSNDDLFIVYNETRSYGSGPGFDNRALIVKVTYSLDR